MRAIAAASAPSGARARRCRAGRRWPGRARRSARRGVDVARSSHAGRAARAPAPALRRPAAPRRRRRAAPHVACPSARRRHRRLEAVAAVVARPGGDQMRRACGASASARRATAVAGARHQRVRRQRGGAAPSIARVAATPNSGQRASARRCVACVGSRCTRASRAHSALQAARSPRPSMSIGVLRPAIASATSARRAAGQRPAAASRGRG